MKRRLFKILSGVSVVLLVATGALWVRSFWRLDCLRRHQRDTDTYLELESDRGWFQATNYAAISPNPPLYGGSRWTINSTDISRSHQPNRFSWRKGHFGIINGHAVRWDNTAAAPRQASRGQFVAFPMILPVTLFGAIGAGTLLFRRRPRIAGHCPICGYDLRATPDRCPECGTVAKVSD